jgi:hypothetical protein
VSIHTKNLTIDTSSDKFKPDATAMIVSADGKVFCVNGHKLARIAQSVDYDQVTTSSQKDTDPVVFRKDGRAVALLMPLQGPDHEKQNADDLVYQWKVLNGEIPGPGAQKCPKCGQWGNHRVCQVTTMNRE